MPRGVCGTRGTIRHHPGRNTRTPTKQCLRRAKGVTVLQFNNCTVGVVQGVVHCQARGESCRLKQRSGHQAGESIPRPLALGSVTERVREPAPRLQVQQLNCHGEEQQMQQTAQSTHHSGAEAHRTAHYQDPAQTLPTQSKKHAKGDEDKEGQRTVTRKTWVIFQTTVTSGPTFGTIASRHSF